jgi:hypothetical protein
MSDNPKILAEQLIRNPHFIQEGKKPTYRIDIFGFIISSSAGVIIKLTKEAAGAADEIVKTIADARKGLLIPVEIVCPDGKTIFKIQARETDTEVRLKQMIKICPPLTAASSSAIVVERV